MNISVAREEKDDENRPNEDTGPQLLQLQPPLLQPLPARFAVTAVLPCFTGFYGILAGRTR